MSFYTNKAKKPFVTSVTNMHVQAQVADQMLRRFEEDMRAQGYREVSPGEWTKDEVTQSDLADIEARIIASGLTLPDAPRRPGGRRPGGSRRRAMAERAEKMPNPYCSGPARIGSRYTGTHQFHASSELGEYWESMYLLPAEETRLQQASLQGGPAKLSAAFLKVRLACAKLD